MLDEVFGERLLISHKADKNELSSNISNDLGDRKGIMSEKGVTAILIPLHYPSIYPEEKSNIR